MFELYFFCFPQPQCVDLPWGSSSQNKQGWNLNWIPTLIGIHKNRHWRMCFADPSNPSYHWTWLDIVHLLVWGKGQVKWHILAPRMYEPDNQKHNHSTLNTLVIRPGLISTLYIHCDNKVWCNTPLWCHVHITSVSQPESSENSEVNIMQGQEISIKQIMVMLDLLNKSWHQQLLMELCVPNNHHCAINSKSYYTVPTA